MNGFKLNTWTALAIAAAVQVAALVSMIWGRVDLLKNGREIVVDVIPVDPRDIFRGDYVILGYNFAQVARETTPMPDGARQNGIIYLTLEPDGQSWKAGALSLEWPETIPAGALVLKGRVDQIGPRPTGGREGRVRFGIENYFVPEGTGYAIETAVRDKKVKAVLAIGRDGTAALKALEIDGKRIHEQAAL